MSFFSKLPNDIVCDILSPRWLDLLEVTKVDTAYCSKTFRQDFLDNLTLIKFLTDETHRWLEHSTLKWIYLRSITVVNLSICMTEIGMEELVQPVFCKLITSHIAVLEIENICGKSCFDSVVSIINSCEKLKYLGISDCDYYILEDIRMGILNQLEEVSFTFSHLVSDNKSSQMNRKQFMIIVNNCKRLIRIMYCMCFDGIHQHDFILLLKNNPNIKIIDVLNLVNVDIGLLQCVQKHCLKLERFAAIAISLADTDDNVMTHITNMMVPLTKLNYVSFCDNKGFDALRYSLCFEYDNSNSGKKTLFSGILATDIEIIEFFSHFGDFTVITLVNEDDFNFDYMALTSAVFRQIVEKNKRTLHELRFEFEETTFTDKDLTLLLQQCSNLRILDIHFSTLTDNEFYHVFSTTNKLADLKLINCIHRISQRTTLCLLENSPTLKQLHLDYCSKVTDKDNKISAMLESRGGDFYWQDEDPYNADYAEAYHVKYEHEELDDENYLSLTVKNFDD